MCSFYSLSLSSLGATMEPHAPIAYRHNYSDKNPACGPGLNRCPSKDTDRADPDIMSMEILVAEAAAAQAALANPIPKENTGALGSGSPSRPTLRSLDTTTLVKRSAPERTLNIPFSDNNTENNTENVLAIALYLEREYPISPLLPQVHDLLSRLNAEFASTAEDIKLQEILGTVPLRRRSSPQGQGPQVLPTATTQGSGESPFTTH